MTYRVRMLLVALNPLKAGALNIFSGLGPVQAGFVPEGRLGKL